MSYHREHNLPPLNVWTNIRLFNVTDDWLMMDTVGNWQLDIADQEAIFPKGAFSPQGVDNFLRNASLYILTNGPVIKDGNTMDGPGGIHCGASSGLGAIPYYRRSGLMGQAQAHVVEEEWHRPSQPEERRGNLLE